MVQSRISYELRLWNDWNEVSLADFFEQKFARALDVLGIMISLHSVRFYQLL